VVAYPWNAGAAGTAGWESANNPADPTWFSTSIGVGGIAVRPTGAGGAVYGSGTRGGFRFTAPGDATIVSATMRGVTGRQADQLRARVYLAPQPGDDGAPGPTSTWGKETSNADPLLDSVFTLTPDAASTAGTPTELRTWLRARPCGTLPSPCADVPANSPARMNIGSVTMTLDDPSGPSFSLDEPTGGDWTNASSVTVTLDADDTESGIRQLHVTADGGASPSDAIPGQWNQDLSGNTLPPFPVSPSTTQDIALPPLGDVQISADATNGAGVTNTDAATIHVDRVAPQIIWPHALIGGQTVVVRDRGAGLADHAVDVDGDALEPMSCATSSAGSSCAYRIPSDTDGDVTASGTDHADNTTEATRTFTPLPGRPAQPAGGGNGTKTPNPDGDGDDEDIDQSGPPIGSTAGNSSCSLSGASDHCDEPATPAWCAAHQQSTACQSIDPTRCNPMASGRRCVATYNANGTAKRLRSPASGGPEATTPDATKPVIDKCATNKGTVMNLSAKGSFAIGHYCGVRDTVQFAGRKVRGKCQGGANGADNCTYQLDEMQPLGALPDDALAGEERGEPVCVLFPLDISNQFDGGQGHGGQQYKYPRKPDSTSAKPRVGCNKEFTDECKSSMVRSDAWEAALAALPNDAEGRRERTLLKNANEKINKQRRASIRKRMCSASSSYLPPTYFATVINTFNGGSANVPYDTDYLNAFDDVIPACQAASPLGSSAVPTPEHQKTLACSADPIRRSTLKKSLSWRFLTSDGRFVMILADKSVKRRNGVYWFYVPSGAISGNTSGEVDAPLDEANEICSSYVHSTRGAKPGQKLTYGYTSPFDAPGATTAHLNNARHWGRTLACSEEPVHDFYGKGGTNLYPSWRKPGDRDNCGWSVFVPVSLCARSSPPAAKAKAKACVKSKTKTCPKTKPKTCVKSKTKTCPKTKTPTCTKSKTKTCPKTKPKTCVKSKTKTCPKTTTPTAKDKKKTSTAKDKKKTSTAKDKNKTSTAKDKNKTSTAKDKKKTSTAKDKKKTSTAKDKNKTSTAKDKNKTSTAKDKKKTSTAQKKATSAAKRATAHATVKETER
jgi:hypothetical protein